MVRKVKRYKCNAAKTSLHFPLYSRALVAIPQLSSFMGHPVMRCILYVTVLTGQTLLPL